MTLSFDYVIFRDRHPKSCYYFSDGHHEEQVCQCFFDYCNAATPRSLAPLALLAALAAAVMSAVRASS